MSKQGCRIKSVTYKGTGVLSNTKALFLLNYIEQVTIQNAQTNGNSSKGA